VLGANDRVRAGVIGTGRQGRDDLEDMARQPDAEIVALCDVYQPNLDEAQRSLQSVQSLQLLKLGSEAAKSSAAKPDVYKDFRQVLDRKDIDVVIVGAPDHWHALPTVEACKAGKDVYVEKPICTVIEEGKKMVQAARKYNRVVQVGTQQRSGIHFQKAVELTSSSQGGRALMDLGRVQNASGKTDDAEKTFRKLSLFPDAEYKPVHATFLWQQGKTDLAIAEFMALAKKDPKNRDARTRLIAAYLQLDKSSEAERILTEALKKNQRDADALLQRSEVYLGEGNVGKAQADVMEVLRFKPDDAAAHYLFAKALHALGAEFQRRQELSESLRLNPSLLRVRIELAEALIEARSSKIALDVLDAAPPDQKHLLPILAMRNWALISSGDAGGARKGIDEALAQSKAPEFMFQDGILKLNQRNMTGARVALEEVLQKSPGDQRAVQALADSYFAEKKYAAGIAKIKEHVAKQPNSTLLQAYLGQILLIDGDNAGARAAFLAAKKTNPSFQPADVGLAMLDARENKLDSARQILHGLMDGPKPNSLAAVRLGGIELSAQNYPAAIAAFRKAVDLRPNDWVPANELARCLDTVGQPDEALKYAQKAKELAPGSPYTVDALGWALYNKGMYSAAIKELDSLSKGQLPEARYHLAMAYFQAGDVASGRATLITALKMDPQNPAAKLAEKVAADASAVALER